MMYLLICLVYPTLLIVTIVALAMNWKKSIRNEFRNDDELAGWMVTLGILFTSFAPLIGFMRFDAFGPEIPFSKNHVLVIELLVLVSAACYWVSKFRKKRLSPAINILVRAGLIQGIILDAVVTIHFTNYFGAGIMFPMFGFELLAPPIAMLFLIYELQCNFKSTQQNASPLFSEDKKILLHAGAVIALIVVEQAILLPAGSQWDSLVSAFTESKGFVFSANSRFNF